jgi:hypothetical protein
MGRFLVTLHSALQERGFTGESVKCKPCNRTSTHHLFVMTDQELKDLVASLVIAQAKTQAEVAETSRVIKEVGRRMGSMASNQGDVAEEFFYNTLFDKPEVGGIRFDRVLRNIGGGKPGHQAEFDVVMHNGSSMAIIEVKYKAHTNDVEQVERQLERYRDIFPEYKDYKLYGGLAGFSVPEDVAQAAREKGLFVLKRKGELMEAETQNMKAF